MLEESIFRKSIPDYSQLLNYGFYLDDDSYFYQKNIEHDSFQVVVMIEHSNVVVKVLDLELGDEYTNFRIDDISGEFAGRIRQQVEEILLDIRDKCFLKKDFVGNQANRISQRIFGLFGDRPYFEWERTPDCGVFKHKSTLKWYGIVMHIKRNKVCDLDGEFDIINVKLNEDKILSLLDQDGFYPAYHMNKKYWISIALDDTLDDDLIMDYIEESYQYAAGSKTKLINHEWIIPANPHYFDIEKALQDSSILTWKQSSNVQIGDTVYLYVGSPVSAIMYQFEVLESDIPYDYQDKNLCIKKVMKLNLLRRYPKDFCPFSVLKKYGVTAIRGPRFMTKELSDYIKNGD